MDARATPPTPHLLQQELLVLARLCDGHSRTAIANDSFLSMSTVDRTIRELKRKLNARNLTELGVKAVRCLGIDQWTVDRQETSKVACQPGRARISGQDSTTVTAECDGSPAFQLPTIAPSSDRRRTDRSSPAQR